MPTLSLGRDEAGAAVVFAPEDLRTHGVVVGMTGSGKTGLSIVVLEELARAGVPIIAIDPKGDLGNLAFLFGALSAEEFAPWVEPGADPAATAEAWRQGLAGSGLSAADVAALRDRVQVTVYTPGSEAGVPVDVLGAFRRPTQAAAADPDTLRAVVAGTVSGLLGLVGRDSDPVRDPAHIVLSHVLEQAWAAGEDPDLETLILRLVDPPFEKVGVFPLDRFFSPDDRMALAMQLNGIVAAPSFQAWTRGAPLDLVALLGGPEGPPPGRVPVHVFTLAHLADPQRQLFLSLLLSGLRAWSRALPGTSGLRAVLFFDEVAGYLPPHPYDPPTKEPLLTLMKQARAVGLGVLLSTQNPVDLDYKALSNAGLWFVGRLQTKQDRDRLLSGLGRPDLDEAVASLGRRRFLVVDAKSDQPRTFATRHAMAFLRGPLTSVEIGRLKAPAAAPAPASPARPSPAPAAPAPAAPALAAPAPAAPATDDGLLAAPPPTPGEAAFLDPRVAFAARMGEVFAAHAGPARPDGRLVLRPALLCELLLRFDEERVGFTLDERFVRCWYPLEQGMAVPASLALQVGDLLPSPPPGALYHPLPHWIDEEKERKALERDVVEQVFRDEARGMWTHTALKLHGKARESREDFDARVQAAIQERVDADVGKLRERYEKEGKRLEEKIRALEGKLVEQKGVVRSRQAEEAVNVGETLWSWFSGRKKSASTALSKRRQTVAAQERVDQAEEQLAALRQEAFDLEGKLQGEVAAIEQKHAPLRAGVEERQVRLEKSDIQVVRFCIVWVPATRRPLA